MSGTRGDTPFEDAVERRASELSASWIQELDRHRLDRPVLDSVVGQMREHAADAAAEKAALEDRLAVADGRIAELKDLSRRLEMACQRQLSVARDRADELTDLGQQLIVEREAVARALGEVRRLREAKGRLSERVSMLERKLAQAHVDLEDERDMHRRTRSLAVAQRPL